MRRFPLVGALVALGVGLAAPAQAQFLSPGALAQAHARLEGDDNCEKCHSSGRGIDVGKCLACHAPIARQIQARRGLHGAGYAGQRCERCHLDHRGRGFRMVRWPGGDPSHLDHALTGWPLRGAHAGTACRACHSGPGGGTRWIGTPTACRSCHEDPHEARFGPRCESCHGEAHWSDVRLERFNHAQTRYPLEGRHAQVACAQCHGQPPRYRGLHFGRCTDCHQDPHEGRLQGECTSCHSPSGWQELGPIRRNHPRLSLAAGHAAVQCRACHDRGADRAPSRGSACASCHRPVHEADLGRNCASCHRGIRWLGLPRTVGLDAHGQTPFPLRGAHVDVDCDRCHDPRKPPAVRFRQLAFDRCTGCHEDRHQGEFATRAGAGDCASCHEEDGFRPTTFGLAAHQTTAFALAGRHQAAPCASCHPGERPRLAFRVQRQACADCHDNPHGDQFAREMRSGGCAQCHTALDWGQPNIDHSTWPLTGAHESALCDSCHSPSPEDRAAGRGSSYRGVPRTCEGCHDDAHAGQFRLSEPVQACDTCHGTTSFRVQRFDHATRTGWALDGRHARVACADCHASTALRNGDDAIRWRLGYRACADCHANPHRSATRGASARPSDAAIEATDCATCHQTSAWRAFGMGSRGGPGFDHARTGFPLTGQHSSANCTTCHVQGRTVRRECATCHADAHQGRLGDSCDGCHGSVSWTATRVQERHRRTRLPLDGAHALVDCAACHRRAAERTFSGTPSQCFACHEDDYRRSDVHPSHVVGVDGAPFSRVCTDCHRTVAWSPAFFPTAGSSAGALTLSAARHDARFPIGFGPHRGATCESCHPSAGAPRAVSCIGCHAHAPARLAAQHAGRAVPSSGVACLRCHPGGMAR